MADEAFTHLLAGTATDQETHEVLQQLFALYSPDPIAERDAFLRSVTMQVALRYGRILDRAKKAGHEHHAKIAEVLAVSAADALESHNVVDMVMVLGSYLAGLDIQKLNDALKEAT